MAKIVMLGLDGATFDLITARGAGRQVATLRKTPEHGDRGNAALHHTADVASCLELFHDRNKSRQAWHL